MATEPVVPQESRRVPRKGATPITIPQAIRRGALERLEAHRLFCELEASEPECSCMQTDPDLFDARGCEYHDPSSPWNAAIRAVTPVQEYARYEPAAVGVELTDVPF